MKTELWLEYKRIKRNTTVSESITNYVDCLENEIEYLWSTTIRKLDEEISYLRNEIKELKQEKQNDNKNIAGSIHIRDRKKCKN